MAESWQAKQSQTDYVIAINVHAIQVNILPLEHLDLAVARRIPHDLDTEHRGHSTTIQDICWSAAQLCFLPGSDLALGCRCSAEMCSFVHPVCLFSHPTFGIFSSWGPKLRGRGDREAACACAQHACSTEYRERGSALLCVFLSWWMNSGFRVFRAVARDVAEEQRQESERGKSGEC